METTPQEQDQAPSTNPVEESLKGARDRLAPKIEQAQQQLAAMNEQVMSFIKENPGTCLLGAAAVGFLIGRLASRR